MGKRGPKPSSPNGEPKKRVTLALASDVREWIYSHKPTVPWLESVMRDLRAEEFRDSGDALPSGIPSNLYCALAGCANLLPRYDVTVAMDGRRFCSSLCAVNACRDQFGMPRILK